MFPLCFDVNGTPVEVRVEKKFGINKYSVPRQEYIKMCEEYANSFIESMKEQFEILGESMDPSVYYQTDAPYYRRITQISFIKMLEKGLGLQGRVPGELVPPLYNGVSGRRGGVRPEPDQAELRQVRRGGRDGEIVIATTRPELICTCQTIAVHPNDDTVQGPGRQGDHHAHLRQEGQGHLGREGGPRLRLRHRHDLHHRRQDRSGMGHEVQAALGQGH